MSSLSRGDDRVVTVSNLHNDLDLTVSVEIIVKVYAAKRHVCRPH